MNNSGITELYWQRSSAAIDETNREYGTLYRALANGILGDSRDVKKLVNDTIYFVEQYG